MTQPLLAVSTSNGRFYAHPQSGRQVPSITNVIGMKDKPALKFWAAKQCSLFAAQNIEVISKLNTEAERVDLIKGAPFRSTSGSSGVGNQVHDWIDSYAKLCISDNKRKSMPPGAWNPEDLEGAPITARRMWKQFVHMANHYDLTWLHSEVTVWSEKHGYAGTGDAVVELAGRCVYLDWKTGNGVYPEVGLQIAALAGADYALDNDGEEFQLPTPERFAVGHIRPTYTRLSPLDGIPECFRAFLGLRAVFEWHCNQSENVIQYAPQLKGPR